MKTTKNINATYKMETGNWMIRDNGETIAEGQGVATYCEAVKKLRATATKKIVEKTIY